eukprot:11186632-Lingulodinium_polyedra.AAC.1
MLCSEYPVRACVAVIMRPRGDATSAVPNSRNVCYGQLRVCDVDPAVQRSVGFIRRLMGRTARGGWCCPKGPGQSPEVPDNPR